MNEFWCRSIGDVGDDRNSTYSGEFRSIQLEQKKNNV